MMWADNFVSTQHGTAADFMLFLDTDSPVRWNAHELLQNACRLFHAEGGGGLRPCVKRPAPTCFTVIILDLDTYHNMPWGRSVLSASV
jgi:hypothetical protein